MKILIGLHPPSSPREIQGLVFRELHGRVRQVGARQGRQKALPASRERKESTALGLSFQTGSRRVKAEGNKVGSN